MSGSQPSVQVSKLERLKEISGHGAIGLPCILVILFMIGQWLHYKFIVTGNELLVNINFITLPAVQCTLDILTFFLFFTINSSTSKDISDKVEGIIICFVCHTFGIFLTQFVVHHAESIYFTPAAFLGLLFLVLQDRICTGVWERPIRLVCHVVMTCGAMLMTSHQDDSNAGNGSVAIAIVFYFNLRNIMLKRLATDNIRLVLRMRVLCTFVSTLMLALFIVGLLGVPHVTSTIMTALFSSAASVLTMYILLNFVFLTHSVFFVTILHLWSRILLQVMFSSPASYVSLLTVGAVIGVTTIIYVTYDPDKKGTAIPLKLKEHTKLSQYEVYTRMEFLIYVGCVIGLIKCLMQPGLSERDRLNLQNIGILSTAEDRLSNIS
ncbi:uncharacterized protein LOC110458137 [Mizuhopecten yessoensis]|uniref:uncharacterized protein LOC110458137 n=1 Tax=Mizuhopecten yessoensis TaxID=6573 RepID=UPI000B45AA2E|nr:uncharacterized protein LOC110458137 [Mizuhopecten yessoensis]